MANVQHSTLTGSDLHECKGAATAASGTTPIANGSGSAPFGFPSYVNLTNKPVIPAISNNGSPASAPKILYLTATAAAGFWSVSFSGLTNVTGVYATSVTSSATLPGSAFGSVATLTSVTTTSASGRVVILDTSGNSSGTTQTVYVMVVGE